MESRFTRRQIKSRAYCLSWLNMQNIWGVKIS